MLDEPTASLDFRASFKIEEIIMQLKEHYTILAVSHSLRQARRIADQVLVFKEGAIVRTLARQEIQQPEIFHHLVEEIF
jgi:phosphate transport system ATP-binding protein